MPTKTINPYYEDFDDQLPEGMDAAYELVRAYAEKILGPLDRFHADGVSILTGKHLTCATLDEMEDICDGKREHGGSMSRFFESHWRLRKDLSDWRPDIRNWPSLWVKYGWAMRQLSDVIPAFNVADPCDIGFEVAA